MLPPLCSSLLGLYKKNNMDVNEFIQSLISDPSMVAMQPSRTLRESMLKNMFAAERRGLTKGTEVEAEKGYREKAMEVISKDDSRVVVRGYLLKWDTLDSHNDITRKGALAETIGDYFSDDSTYKMKLLINHDRKSLDAIAGVVTDIKEDEYGAYFEALLREKNENHQKVVDLLKEGLFEVSFGFRYTKGEWIEEKEESFFEVKGMDVKEISLVTIASSPFTPVEIAKTLPMAKKEIDYAKLANMISNN